MKKKYLKDCPTCQQERGEASLMQLMLKYLDTIKPRNKGEQENKDMMRLAVLSYQAKN